MSRPHPDEDAVLTVRPQTPPRLRHQDSLEHILTFTLSSPVRTPDQSAEGKLLYCMIADDCGEAGATLLNPTGQIPPPSGDQIDVPLNNFFHALYEHSPTEPGRVNLVRMILHGLFSPDATGTPQQRSLEQILPLARAWPFFAPAAREPIFIILAAVARDLLQRFFAPLKAQGSCSAPVTALLTPPGVAALGRFSEQGTPRRLANLRQRILHRDGHRCVISGFYDTTYIVTEREAGRNPPATFGMTTEAAHIIPHSLNKLSSPTDTELPPRKSFVWSILNMFDPGIAQELSGDRIDSPANALLLEHNLHDEFGKLHWYLEAVGPRAPHTYHFRATKRVALPQFLIPDPPVVTFSAHGTGTRLPDPRLFKLHAACCKMLAMAAAGAYVDRLVRDLDETGLRGTLAEDGSSALGLILAVRGLEE